MASFTPFEIETSIALFVASIILSNNDDPTASRVNRVEKSSKDTYSFAISTILSINRPDCSILDPSLSNSMVILRESLK